MTKAARDARFSPRRKMLRGDAALAALDSPHGPKRAKTDGWKGDIVGAPNAFVPPRDWDKWLNGLALNSPKCCLAGLAVLPTVRDPNAAPVAPAPSSKKNEAAHRKDLIHAQKGVSLRVPEAIELVDAVMNGRAHADYVYVGGQQHIVTTVVENAWYGKATSTSVASGVVLVKTHRSLLVGTYADPVTAADAIVQVHKIADDCMQAGL